MLPDAELARVEHPCSGSSISDAVNGGLVDRPSSTDESVWQSWATVKDSSSLELIAGWFSMEQEDCLFSAILM